MGYFIIYFYLLNLLFYISYFTKFLYFSGFMYFKCIQSIIIILVMSFGKMNMSKRVLSQNANTKISLVEIINASTFTYRTSGGGGCQWVWSLARFELVDCRQLVVCEKMVRRSSSFLTSNNIIRRFGFFMKDHPITRNS